jgi:hypothetical protein
VDRWLSLDGSRFTGKLDMGYIHMREGLGMRGAEFGEVDLRGAKIGGQLVMDRSKFSGPLKMNIAEIAGSLQMRDKAEFGEVDLRGAQSALPGRAVIGLQSQHDGDGQPMSEGALPKERDRQCRNRDDGGAQGVPEHG